MSYGIDQENKNLEEVGTKKRAPYTVWQIADTEYKLKLTTAVICQLEEKFKGNLLTLISSGSVPPLSVMLTIIQGAMKPWAAGIKYKEVQDLFDQYCEEGGTQMSLMIDVLIPVYEVSGFFSAAQTETMNSKMKEAKARIQEGI